MTRVLRQVEAPAGRIIGWEDGPVLRATGIRYARAERHAEPVPEPETDDDVAALEWSPRCPQRVNPLATPGGDPRRLRIDEHCQYLSITTPVDVRPDEMLPVMVWIHGGSYETGAGDDAYSDPVALVSEQRVIVVAVTYRLGPLGFLGGDRRPANLGLLDQILALRWVARNIASFGGDPDTVTIFGQSAGGDAVVHLMISDGAHGLFRRVIAQSPPLGISLGRARMAAAMAKRARELPGVLDDEAMIVESRRIVRGLPVRSGWVASMPFGVQYGRKPLPAEDELDDAFRCVASSVGVLIGSTHREAALFAELIPVFAQLGRHRIGRVVYEAAVKRVTRRVYGRGIDWFVVRHRDAGGSVWRYLLDWGAGPRFQGSHVIDLALLFPTQPWTLGVMLEGLALDAVARQGRPLRRMWADFARTGKVTVEKLPGILRIV